MRAGFASGWRGRRGREGEGLKLLPRREGWGGVGGHAGRSSGREGGTDEQSEAGLGLREAGGGWTLGLGCL